MQTATRTIAGWAVPLGTDELIERRLKEKNYEIHQLALIEEFVKPYHRVLEGGAGLGVTTRRLSELANFVVSLEANEEMYHAAEQNASEAVVAQRVLSGKHLTAPRETAHTGDAFGVGETEAIPEEADSLIDAYRLNALVLDVEGEEAAILGSLKRLEDLELIIVEMHPDRCGTLPLVRAHKRLFDAGFREARKIEDGDIFHVAYAKGEPRG